MKYTLKFTDEQEFQSEFLSILQAKGLHFETGYEFTKSGNVNQLVHREIEEQGESTGEVNFFTIQVLNNIDWVTVYPKHRDLNGDFVVLESDVDGNPILYQMEPGYYVNVVSNVSLEIDSQFITNPETPQYKWA